MAKRGDYTASVKQQRAYQLRLAINNGLQQNPGAAQQLMALQRRMRENLNDDDVFQSTRDGIQAAVAAPQVPAPQAEMPAAQDPAARRGGGQGRNILSRAGQWFRHRFGGR